jgi:hypothetical protein
MSLRQRQNNDGFVKKFVRLDFAQFDSIQRHQIVILLLIEDQRETRNTVRPQSYCTICFLESHIPKE